MKYFILFLVISLLLSCGGKRTPDDIYEPLSSEIKLGRFVSASPFWKSYKPGTILLIGEDSIDMLHDNSWIKSIGAKVEQESIEDKMKRDCDKGSCTLASSVRIKKGWTASFNATLSEDAYFKVRGTNLKETTKSVYVDSRYQFIGQSGLSAFNTFKNNPKYADDYTTLKESIKYSMGEREGKVILVTEINLVFMGDYKLTFDKKLTAEAALKIAELVSLKIGGGDDGEDLSFIWNDSELILKASIGTPAFLDGWKLETIKLD